MNVSIKGLKREIQELRNEEKRLRALEQEVERQVAVRTAELEREKKEIESLAAELKRSNAELDLFASVASHDLQEPLRKIMGFGDQLARRNAERLDAEGLDFLARIRKTAARMSTLIEELLDFARVKTSDRPFEAVELAAVMDDVLLEVEERIAKSRARVEVGALPSVRADRLQMRMLLLNLVVNALKFQRAGEAPRVWVNAERRAGMVVLSVRDNGIGFDPRYREKIFEPFTRLHPRTEYEGSGMGLAICARIARRHGGSVSADSEPGRGASFTVVLPAPEEEPHAA